MGVVERIGLIQMIFGILSKAHVSSSLIKFFDKEPWTGRTKNESINSDQYLISWYDKAAVYDVADTSHK